MTSKDARRQRSLGRNVIFRPFPRFFQSLGGSGASSSGTTIREALQTPCSMSRSLGDAPFEINFSLESLLAFKEDHEMHQLIDAPRRAAGCRQRPNYDSRKRKFFAKQIPERRKWLDKLLSVWASEAE